MTEKIDKTGNYIGLRIPNVYKQKIEKYAKDNGFSVGELMTIAILLHIGEKEEAGKLLIKKETKK